MDNITIGIVAILALLVVAVIIRYGKKAEAKFSIFKLLEFGFGGSNQNNDDQAPTLGTREGGVSLEQGANLTAQEIVG